MTVLAAHRWPTNGHLIADVAKLGYLDGRVLDPTYGVGTFWNQFTPDQLVACDLEQSKSPFGCSVDFTSPRIAELGVFDAVVFDPPYKLNGTPDGATDYRYGVHEVRTAEQRMRLIGHGVLRLKRRVKPGGFLLVKVQDQVCSGRMWWQTDFVSRLVARDFDKVDRFDFLGNHRPQPMAGRTQKHAHGRPSTLLVFKKRR